MLALPLGTCQVLVDGVLVDLPDDRVIAERTGDDLHVGCGAWDVSMSSFLELWLDADQNGLVTMESEPGSDQLVPGVYECLGWPDSTSIYYNVEATPWFSLRSTTPPLPEPACAIKIVSIDETVVRGTFWAPLDQAPYGSDAPDLVLSQGVFVLPLDAN
ncbi:MAG: hypothetical protein F9K40_04840 [Kofleriaceae bacterium]|nr:MAG: hypothetical protein F9K40_04840 [Kofleriaceae bacterium]MBZ0237966.1 hypothetical protein [Kofleriaceae bacterium]